MLERNVEVGQDQPVGHQRNQLAHVGVGVDVVQAHPWLVVAAQAAKITREVGDVGAMAAIFGVFDVDAVSRRVLANHQQFFNAILDQLFSLAQHGMGRAALQFAAHVGNDAELALVVTTF